MKHSGFIYAIIALLCISVAGCEKNGTENDGQATSEAAPFKLTIKDVTSVMATVEVEPLDKEMTYYTDILNDHDFQQAMQHGFDDYMTYFIEDMKKRHDKSNTIEIVRMIASHGNDAFILTTLTPDTKYHAFAVGINRSTGMPTTEVVSQEFTTTLKETSDNTFEVSIKDISALEATIEVKPSNNDKYIVAVEPTSAIEGMSDTEIADYIIQSNMAWGGLEQITYSGEASVEHLGKAGWAYEALIFGYSNGMATTDVVRKPFDMLPGGDPTACSFTFGCEFDTFTMELSTVPSDNSVVYVSNIIKETDLQALIEAEGSEEAALKENLEMLIDELIIDCGSRARAVDVISMMEEVDYSLKYEFATNYILWAVPVDQDGVPTAAFSCSDVFTSPAEVVSTATLTLDSYTYYDGSELADLYPGTFAGATGFAVVDLRVTPSEDAVNWWSYIAMEDLTDRSKETIIKNLQIAPQNQNLTQQYVVAYWGVNTIMGVAQDADGIYGPLMLQVANFDKETATPASELIFEE